MFSWFTGTDDKSKSAEPPAPGFHPVALPNTTLANPYVAPTVSSSSSPPPSSLMSVTHAPAAGPTAPTPLTAPVASLNAMKSTTEMSNLEVAPATSSFLFDGMAIGKGRRRRPAAFTQPSSSAAEATKEDSVGETATAVQPLPVPSVPCTSPSTEVRQRLEDFYRLYNPTKLAHVEKILEVYEGKETQLFQELVERYGPEPVGLSSTHLSSLQGDSVTAHALAAPSESEMSAFRFISPTAEAEVAAWAAPRDDDAPPASLAAEKAPNSSISSSSPSSAAPAEPPALSQQTVTDAASPMPLAPPSSAFEEEEEEETLEERHRRELRASQGVLLEARAALAAMLREAEDALRVRQDSVAHIHALESKIQDCVHAEEYREADALSDAVGEAAIEVRRCDEVWASLGRRVSAAQRRLEEAVRGVASLLRTHEIELQAREEAEETRVQARRHHDDSDLRLREETVLVRKEDLSVRRAAAETRLRTARAVQSEVQQRVDATLKTVRTQHETLTTEVAHLDSEIDDLKAKLVQLEERRASARTRLSVVADKLQASKAAHASELDVAAANVESVERDVQRVTQQEKDVEAECASIAAERADRESAAALLLQDLKAQQDQREAVHHRTRALEQDTIPASDRYWRSWQDLLSRRLRGAEVLFEIPAAAHPELSASGAPSALTKKTDLLKQLDEMAGELHADEELRRDAQRRLEACESRVAPLTAAKAAAVASKNFKAAQQYADELKVVQLSMEGCQDDVDLYSGQVRALDRTMQRLRNEVAAAEAQTQRYAVDFLRDYGTVMAAFDATASDTPDYVQLPKESQGADELADAAHALWVALQQEWLRVSENAPPAASPTSSTAATVDASSSLPSASCPAELPGTVAAAAVEATETAVAPPSAADVQRHLDALQSRLEVAIAHEAFAECETIQREIDQLETELTPLTETTTAVDAECADQGQE